MTRPERHRLIKQYGKELSFILKHTPYLKFKNTSEFMLPKEELDLLVANTHENKVLQEKFNLAKDLYARVDALTSLIWKLKETRIIERPVSSVDRSLDLQNVLS